MAGVQISNIATKQDLMCGANFLNVTYVSSNDYTVSGMIECAGAWYRFVDEPVTVTTSDYIKIVPSTGTATLAAITSFTGVAFDTDKNGYYVTGTNERVFAYRALSNKIVIINNNDFYTIGVISSSNGSQITDKFITEATTGGILYNTLSQFLPDTGEYGSSINEIKISGAIENAGDEYIVTSIRRSSSTNLAIYAYKIGVGTGSIINLTSGSSTEYKVHLVW